MNGAGAPPPPMFDEKAAEDLFGFLPPESGAELRKILLANKQMHDSTLQRLGSLAGMQAQQANLQNQAGMQNAYNNQQALQGMGVAQQCIPQYGSGLLAGGSAVFKGGPSFPSLGHQLGINQIPAHDHALNEIQAHDHAMTMMNPLARNRYEDVIKLLGIKIRCVNRADLVCTTEWVLQKQIKDGRQVKFTWSVDDPGGGSFQHWKHMFDTLVDRCAELDGNDVPDTNNTADTQSAGV